MAASDKLKGCTGRACSYEYVLALFFWKYISDIWNEKYDSLTALYDAETSRRRMSNSRYYIPLDASFYDTLDKGKDRGIGLHINLALEKFSMSNSKLEGLFEG